MFEAILSAQGVCGTAAYRPPENRRLYDASPGKWVTRDFFCKARQSGVKPCGNLIRT